MAVHLDLRRDLPKVREQYPKVLAALATNSCDYTAPCVIGAMVAPSERLSLETGDYRDDVDDNLIGTLIKAGLVDVAAGQIRDVVDLQKIFDLGDRKRFETKLKKLEAKYLPEQVPA